MSNNCGNATLVFSTPPCGRQHFKKGNVKRRCSSTAAKKKFLCMEANGSSSNGSNCGGEKKKNFMEEVWKVMTPDMLQKLVDILVEDFHMSRAEACNFIQQQRDSTKTAQKIANGKCPCAPDMVPAIPNLDVRNAMIKEFIDVTSCKLSDYMALMLCARKTRRQEVLSKTMRASMNDFFGNEGGDDSYMGKIISFAAEKLGYWLDLVFEDQVCKDDKGSNEETKSQEDKKDEEEVVEEVTEAEE